MNKTLLNYSFSDISEDNISQTSFSYSDLSYNSKMSKFSQKYTEKKETQNSGNKYFDNRNKSKQRIQNYF